MPLQEQTIQVSVALKLPNSIYGSGFCYYIIAILMWFLSLCKFGFFYQGFYVGTDL